MSDDRFLPLSPTNFYILAGLMRGPTHGYALLKLVDEASEGEVAPGIGNFYVALRRLMEQGLIERTEDESGEVDGRRKTYRITGLGQSVLDAQEARLRRMMRAMPRFGLLGAESSF